MSNRSKPYVDFQRIRESVGIEEVLRRYGAWQTLKGHGAQLRGPCPIHAGSNKRQFSVNLKKDVWHCFGDCAGGGNVLDFVMAMEGCDARTAGLKLAEWFGLPIKSSAQSNRTSSQDRQSDDDPQGSGEEAEEDDEPEANAPLTFDRLKHLQHDHDALTARGIDPATAEQFGVGYATRGIMRGCIAVPVHNPQGELVAYAGANPNDTTAPYRWPKGFRPELELFNAHRARATRALKREGLIIAADPFDVLALHDAGHDNAVALLGEQLSDAQFQLLSDFCSTMRPPRISCAYGEQSFADDTVAWLAELAWVRVQPLGAL